MPDSTRSLRFGVFEVDLRAGEVHKRGLKVNLQPQPFRILAILLEHPGDLVTQDELRRKLWPDTIVNFDCSLKTAMNKIRKALGDSPCTPNFIETLPRRGYRFIAPIQRLASTSRSSGKERSERIRLAVVPFESLSDDPEQREFTDGLTREITTQIVRLDLQRLGPIFTTSATQCKGSGKDIRQIGRQLRVEYILSGCVRHAGNRVRISAQVIQVSDQTLLWAQTCETKVADTFASQEEVARRIARSLRAELLPSLAAQLKQGFTAVARTGYPKDS